MLLLFMPLMMGQNYGSGIAMVNQQPAGSPWSISSSYDCDGTDTTEISTDDSIWVKLINTSGGIVDINTNSCECAYSSNSECDIYEWTTATTGSDVAFYFLQTDINATGSTRDSNFGARLEADNTGYTLNFTGASGAPLWCQTDWDVAWCQNVISSTCDSGPGWDGMVAGDYYGATIIGTGTATEISWYDFGGSAPGDPSTWSSPECVKTTNPGANAEDSAGTWALRLRDANGGQTTRVDDLTFWEIL